MYYQKKKRYFGVMIDEILQKIISDLNNFQYSDVLCAFLLGLSYISVHSNFLVSTIVHNIIGQLDKCNDKNFENLIKGLIKVRTLHKNEI